MKRPILFELLPEIKFTLVFDSKIDASVIPSAFNRGKTIPELAEEENDKSSEEDDQPEL